MSAILEVRADAIFIQSESSEYFHAESPAAIKPAEFYNARRFLSLDLNYGRRVDSDMFLYLMDSGMSRDEYAFFMEQNLKRHCIMGNVSGRETSLARVMTWRALGRLQGSNGGS